MAQTLGRRLWAIPEGYIPGGSVDPSDPAPYASLIRASVPIIVRHTRLDSRNPSIALLSTIAFALD
jgi:hypothetical protein